MRRVLQVVAVPDGAPLAAAVELHRFLDLAGVEVRSLAGGPAPSGTASDHEPLPPMAPSARSLAALTQLRREARWADVVVLRGRAASWLARGAGPASVWCVDDPLPGRPLPRRRVGAVVRPDDLPPVVVPPVRLPAAARLAARVGLGVPDGAPVARVRLGVDGRTGPELGALLAAGGWWVVPGGADGELAAAAADVVVHVPSSAGAPDCDVLRDVLAGAVPLTPAGGDWHGASLDPDAFAGALRDLADESRRATAAAVAADGVLERHGPDSAGVRWLELLRGVARV